MMGFAADALNFMAVAFVVAVGLVVASAAALFVVDRVQTADAIRRNYPVIGRFRHIFTDLGEFFRQYFFAMDREELPFNRAQRDWVKRAGAGQGNTIAFGSTRNTAVPGTPVFVNAPFPPLDDQFAQTEPLRIGPHARRPFDAPSFFNISGMSYGAISRPAVLALSHGAKAAGIWLNTGEGGLSPFHLEGGCDVVFQIGTAKFGVRDADGRLSDDKLREVAAHESVRMFELKLAQGAKPGKGGILPGTKVTEEIARIRGLRPGQDGISPNRHAEVEDWNGLLDLVGHVREVTGKPVGIKTVVGGEEPMREFFDAVSARGAEHAPDFVTIDGGEGGSGAAPMPLMDLVGMSVREALPLVARMRREAGLKSRIRLVASGKLVNPGDIAWALATGADFVTSARGFMFALGCIQALKCNKNTCPTGITTHDKRFQKGLVVKDKKARVANYAKAIIKEVEAVAHSVGAAEPRLMRPRHVRLVQEGGRSVPMSVLMDDLPRRTRPGDNATDDKARDDKAMDDEIGLGASDLIARHGGTKSGAIRALDARGMKRADIARALEIRYQHVRNVLEQDGSRLARKGRADAGMDRPGPAAVALPEAGTGGFWVYTNIPNNKALIHLADCSHCNHGRGREAEGRAANGEWHGPYSEEQARTFARRSGKRRIQWCGFCARRHGIEPGDV